MVPYGISDFSQPFDLQRSRKVTFDQNSSMVSFNSYEQGDHGTVWDCWFFLNGLASKGHGWSRSSMGYVRHVYIFTWDNMIHVHISMDRYGRCTFLMDLTLGKPLKCSHMTFLKTLRHLGLYKNKGFGNGMRKVPRSLGPSPFGSFLFPPSWVLQY